VGGTCGGEVGADGRTRWLEGRAVLLQSEAGFGEAVAVDLEFDAVATGVVAAGGEIANGLGFPEIEGGAGGEAGFRPLEDLFGGAAAGFDVVDEVVDGEALGFARGGGDGGGEGEGLAELEGRGGDGEAGSDGGFLAETEEGEGLGMAALDEGAAGVFGDPTALRGGGDVPGGEAVEHPVGVVFGDVVEVVGDGFADVEGGIVAQGVEDASGGLGVLHKRLQAEAPGEAGAGAFAGEAAHVLAGVGGPVVHHVQSAVEVALDEGADGELGGAEAGEVAEGFEGEVGFAEAEGGDEVGQEDADEVMADDGGGLFEDGDFLAEGTREGGIDREGGLVHALHEAALREAVEGGGEEAFGVELRGGGLEEGGEGAVEGFVEPVLELGGRGGFGGHGGALTR
jgi:hypothetical protein